MDQLIETAAQDNRNLLNRIERLQGQVASMQTGAPAKWQPLGLSTDDRHTWPAKSGYIQVTYYSNHHKQWVVRPMWFHRPFNTFNNAHLTSSGQHAGQTFLYRDLQWMPMADAPGATNPVISAEDLFGANV